MSQESGASLALIGQIRCFPPLIGPKRPGAGEVCRRINEIHLLSRAPAPAVVRREARSTGRVIAVGFFGLIDNSTVGRRKLLVIIPRLSRYRKWRI